MANDAVTLRMAQPSMGRDGAEGEALSAAAGSVSQDNEQMCLALDDPNFWKLIYTQKPAYFMATSKLSES
jgi:hypothetical protein